MVLHMPWNRNLGGPRVQLELADEFRAMGHHVEKFDIYDAFPQTQSSRFAEFIRPSFAAKAKAFVQANADNFDIIDAHQGNLPFSKQELGFHGLLVARSVGLYAFCEAFAKLEKTKWPKTSKGNPIANMLRYWRQQLESPNYLRSLQTCDLINLPNNDEFFYIQEHWGLGDKCAVFPFGLSQKRQQAFAKSAGSPSTRLTKKQVVFIGYWTQRKGSRDWRKILTSTKAKVPQVRFLLLGTGLSVTEVLQDLHLPASDWLEIIPQYDSEELPKIISEATVAAFPSYMEGFGFGVLEKIASGLPTVAYDIPGPREMLRPLDTSLMVPVGQIEAFTQKLIELLQLDEANYTKLSQRCMEVAQTFSWSRIAKEHLEIYSEFIEKKNSEDKLREKSYEYFNNRANQCCLCSNEIN